MPKKMSLAIDLVVDDDATESSLRAYIEEALPKQGLTGETSQIDIVEAVYELVTFTK